MNSMINFKRYGLIKTHYLSIGILFMIFLFFSCKSTSEPESISPYEIALVIDQVTEIMVHDVTNPPLAARFFAYICLSGLEALNDSSSKAVTSKINAYPMISDDTKSRPQGHPQITAVLAMLHTSAFLQPSGYKHAANIEAFKKKLLGIGFSPKIIEESEVYSKAISENVIKFALNDGYNKTSNFPRYTPLNSEGSWFPTPPGYFPPVEPYFSTIRSFFLDSASQFLSEPPTIFSNEKNSDFYKMLEEVYTQDLTEEKKMIASFWDCNPFALEDKGHLVIGLKKISPGAHWMGIANIACKDAGLDFNKSMEVNAVLAMTLQDAFITCWDEKFRSNRMRPETAIRKYIDPNFIPFLQTPPFPEYLSGHSVASTAAAKILTHYFGHEFSYRDTVEIKFGLPARDFGSFEQAAEEAAISRLYGGIHYRDGIEQGQKQGKKVGDWVVAKLLTD